MSGFLLDTNVLSEAMLEPRNPGVVTFLTGVADAYVSVLTLHELIYGIERLPQGRKKTDLTRCLESTVSAYGDFVLPLDEASARMAGPLRAARQAEGRHIDIADALIAATALTKGLTLATRNLRDFEGIDLSLLNPFE